ncbi:unnamed protein product [Miscanthus lutarioriparius]|uniref:HEAT repeat-containing protein 1 n=1 Tax=Miscanthus lutarioriparius TaxID=422564 RepID=A0A811QV57_9POAL|nr:unnamed protein product [Miscanthus lutarioriparius]
MKLTEGTLVGHFFFVLRNGPSPKLISPHQRKVWTVQLFSTNWFTNLLNNTALVLKALYKCFLYDNDQKILDSSNFQVLLKPIVSQFVVEPPESIESVMDAPSIEEVDENIILCLGQVAVTARSDVLWKPLSHEVLMQTRSDKVRPKMLGLKVIRYMVQHLKEEYVVLLPETIPFLGELLEDVELPVTTLSQEILKGMETLSGESLGQYL